MNIHWYVWLIWSLNFINLSWQVWYWKGRKRRIEKRIAKVMAKDRLMFQNRAIRCYADLLLFQRRQDEDHWQTQLRWEYLNGDFGEAVATVGGIDLEMGHKIDLADFDYYSVPE